MRTRNGCLLLFVVWVLGLEFRVVLGRSFVQVGADEEECFFEDLRKGETLRGSYQVIQGGYLDIDVTVSHVKTNNKLYDAQRQEEGRFEFEANQEGRYRVCFGNKLSTNTAKKVQFSLHAGDVDELLEHEVAENLADTMDLDRVNRLVLKLGRRVSDLKEQEEYLRRRHERHHRTAESTSSRVLLSSICEAVVLLVMNLWQTHFLRQFFEVKRVI